MIIYITIFIITLLLIEFTTITILANHKRRNQ